MGNCCSSSFPEEQLPRPPPGRRGYPVGNTHNAYHTNPVLELLEEEYQSKRNFEAETKGRSRGKRNDRERDIGPRRNKEWEIRSGSRSGTRKRAARSGKRSRAIRPKNSRRKPKGSRRRRKDFSEDEDEDEEDDSDSDDSEFEASDDDDELDSDIDSDSDAEIYRRKMSKSVKSRRKEQPRNKRPGKRGKVIIEDEDDDYDEFLEDEEDGDDEDEYKRHNKQNSKRKKSKSKTNTKEIPKDRAKGKAKPKSKVKKVKEDDKIALLESEEDENDIDNDDAEDEDGQEANKYPQSKDYEAGGKGKEPETPNPYRWTNSSQIFDKNKTSIYQRARSKGSDRESIRQLEIQRHRKRRERESSLKHPKKSISESPGDDDWTDTDASSIAPSKRSGSTSSRLSSLFGPRNRSLTPEPTSHLMSPISPLTRPSISSKSGEPIFGASVIKASPLQEIVSADSLPANPEPKDAMITPPPAVHQRPASPLTKAAEPCPEGMKKVIFMSRGKRSSIKLIPSDGKHKATDDVEIILTK
ncbi:hypothetical protein EAE96_010039 [Botrytis aclada]|nr:hypothetical protein EAE96_010039 [Botrytis aclada]